MSLFPRPRHAIVVIATGAFVAAAGAAVQGGSAPVAVTPDAVRWTPNPRIAGVASANLVGDQARRGLYVTLGRMQRGAMFPPHSHPDRRVTTVVSGTMYYGTGRTFDRRRVRRYPAGSVVQTPAGVPHFMWAKDGTTIMQETGIGPSGLTFAPRR